MLSADDMVYLVRRIRIVFMEKTVFAAIGSTFCDESPLRFPHSVAKLRVLTCPRLRHDHDVFKLQVVLEF
jgi:hypothetical protein